MTAITEGIFWINEVILKCPKCDYAVLDITNMYHIYSGSRIARDQDNAPEELLAIEPGQPITCSNGQCGTIFTMPHIPSIGKYTDEEDAAR